MADMVFKLIIDDTDPILDQVKPLFSAMYRGMREQGLKLPLAEDGADSWFSSALNALGRFGVIAAAIHENKLVGFAHGALKFLPDHLGGYKTGVVTHIFVKTDHRKQNTGDALLKILEDWFHEKKVHSIELQVIAGNDARQFWEKEGYHLELYQYRKFPGENS